MLFFLNAIKREPLGALAIVAALLPFIFDVAKEYVFNSINMSIECDKPGSTDFRHGDGFLYYESRCLISNRSRDPVSVVSLVPVMTHGDYPYPLVGVSDFLPIIKQRSPDRLNHLVEAMESTLPANMGGRQSFAFNAVFTTYVGQLRPYGPMSGCAESLEFERLSSVYTCINDGTGAHPAERKSIDRSNTIKEQIYDGFSIFLADFDGFGLMVVLGNGNRYLVEADLTDVKGYRCNDEIRELTCPGFGINGPQVIDIGVEPDYSPRASWRVYASIFAVAIVVSILAQLTWAFFQFTIGWYRGRAKSK